MRALKQHGYLLVLGFALAELIAHFVSTSRVPTDDDWARAAAFVRADLRDTDAIVAAPDYVDPLVRRELGDTMSLAEAGYSDLDAFERVWALSVRGHRPTDVGDAPPALERAFGPVRVSRWDRGTSHVRYDFTDHLDEATVTYAHGASDGCRLVTTVPRGGGLGRGPMVPAQRFTCGNDPEVWVGETVIEDLSLRPRRCIRFPATPEGRLSVTWKGVSRGDRLVVYAGLYAEDERMREGSPILLRVARNGRALAALRHEDGEGWKRAAYAIASGGPDGGDTWTFESVSTETHRRSLCVAASIRSAKESRR